MQRRTDLEVLSLTSAAAVAGAHLGLPGLLLAVALLTVAVVSAAAAPERLLPGLFPLLYMLGLAPQELGAREAIYAAFAAVACGGTLVRHWQATVQWLRRLAPALAVAALLLIANFTVTLQGGGTAAAWAWNVAPFLFILAVLPIAVAVSAVPASRRELMLGCAVGAGLYAVGALTFAAWYGLLSQPVEAAAIAKLAAGLETEPGGTYYLRLTKVFPRVSDPLAAAGIVWGALVLLFAQRKWLAALGGLLAAAAAVAVILSFTRSSLGAAGLVVAAVMLLQWRHVGLRRTLLCAGWLGAVVIGFGLISGIAGPTIQRTATAGELILSQVWSGPQRDAAGIGSAVPAADPPRPTPAVPGPSGGEEISGDGTSGAADSPARAGGGNVPRLDERASFSNRLQELRAAAAAFTSAPLLGRGFGADRSIHYVHNLFGYTAAHGGIALLGAHLAVLLLPAWLVRRSDDRLLRTAVVATLGLLFLYSLTFMVFKLLSFNLILGTLWGLLLAERHATSARTRVDRGVALLGQPITARLVQQRTPKPPI